MSDRQKSIIIKRGVNQAILVPKWLDNTQTSYGVWPAGTYTAELRAALIDGPARAPVLATFIVDDSQAANGALLLALTNEASEAIDPINRVGFMDILYSTGGEPYSVLLEPLRCKIVTTITAPTDPVAAGSPFTIDAQHTVNVVGV